MIDVHDDRLIARFPELHPGAVLEIEFQRALRVPDGDRPWPLPPELGRLPLRRADEFAVPARGLDDGGAILPIHPSDAIWLKFTSRRGYPFAVRVATGRVDALTGEAWGGGLRRTPQNYLSIPSQPWLDGYCVERGVVRQFVAVPAGQGQSAEEQLAGRMQHGGMQLLVVPLRREIWERVRPPARVGHDGFPGSVREEPASPAPGIAPGGRMRQEIYRDPFRLSDWETSRASRCFVHPASPEAWVRMTGARPPGPPPSPAGYTRAGLPWFDYHGDQPLLDGGARLAALVSVGGAESAYPGRIFPGSRNQVREGAC